MKLNILAVAFHRNGICGEPFDVVLEDERPGGKPQGRRSLRRGESLRLLERRKLAAGDIAFGSTTLAGRQVRAAPEQTLEATGKE